jgi:hypothetical protein
MISKFDLTSLILENHVQEFVVRWYFVPNSRDAYCVGSDGSVWSRYVLGSGGKGGWVLGDDWVEKSLILSGMYLRCALSFNGKEVLATVHQLVAGLFIGPCPPGLHVCHNDNNSQNNHVCNLRYDTPKGNHHDRFKKNKAKYESNRYCNVFPTKKSVDLTPMILENHVQEFAITWYFVPNTRDAYCVGSDGSVWSRYVRVRRGFVIGGMDHWRQLLPTLNSSGYLSVGISFNGRSRSTTLGVHQLVASVFLGPCPLGLECCHEDGDRQNNHACNLKYDTHTSNERDKLKHGTRSRGEGHYNAFLTQGLADLIREEYATGDYTQRQLGKKYGVSQGTIGRVVRYAAWVPVDLIDTLR